MFYLSFVSFYLSFLSWKMSFFPCNFTLICFLSAFVSFHLCFFTLVVVFPFPCRVYSLILRFCLSCIVYTCLSPYILYVLLIFHSPLLFQIRFIFWIWKINRNNRISKLQKCKNAKCRIFPIIHTPQLNHTYRIHSVSLPHPYCFSILPSPCFLSSPTHFAISPRLVAQDGFPDPAPPPAPTYRSVTLALGCGPKASSYCFYHESHF